MKIFSKLMNRFVVIFTCLSIVCLTGYFDSYGSNTFGVRYDALGCQYDFIDLLVDNQVPFYLDIDGIIVVDESSREKADTLMKQVESRPFTKVEDPKYASAIVLLFAKNGISYDVREDTRAGVIYIMWSEEDDGLARQIVDREFLKLLEDSYTSKKLGSFHP